MTGHIETAQRLRAQVQSLRRKPTPLADLIPLLTEAADALEAAPPAPAPPQALNDDAQCAIDRAADLLEQYAGYIREVRPEDIERHPYLPEVESVASELREFSRAVLAAGVQQRKPLTDERVDELLDKLDDIAHEHDIYEFGLPMGNFGEDSPLHLLRAAVRDWAAHGITGPEDKSQ